MPINRNKIMDIIKSQSEGVDERYEGYRDMLSEQVIRIFNAEEDHLVNPTRIQQKVEQELDTASNILYKNRSQQESEGGDDS